MEIPGNSGVGKTHLFLREKNPALEKPIPIGSMYGTLFTYIQLIFMVNVGVYTIHGSYGICFKVAC